MLANCVGEPVLSLISLSATRWCVRASAIKRVCSTYSQILEVLSQLSQDNSVHPEPRAKIAGLVKQARKVQTYYGLLLCLVRVKWWPKPCSHCLRQEHMTLKPAPIAYLSTSVDASAL